MPLFSSGRSRVWWVRALSVVKRRIFEMNFASLAKWVTSLFLRVHMCKRRIKQTNTMCTAGVLSGLIRQCKTGRCSTWIPIHVQNLGKISFAVCVNTIAVAIAIDTVTTTTTPAGSILLPAALHQMPVPGHKSSHH